MTASWYVLENLNPVSVAWCVVPVAVGGVQTTGASRPYTTRPFAGSFVCQTIVAENGDSETVCTSSIVGGGPEGAAGGGFVVESVGGGDASPAPGSARKVNGLPDGALKATALEESPPVDVSPLRATDCASTPESGRSPGVGEPDVSRPTGTTGRPLGRANSSDAGASGAAERAAAGDESE